MDLSFICSGLKKSAAKAFCCLNLNHPINYTQKIFLSLIN